MWTDWLDKEVLRAHNAWLRADRSGPGRLVREGRDLSDAMISGVRMTAARFEECDLSRAYVELSEAEDIELIRCVLAEANLTGVNACGATIEGTNFVGIQAAHLELDNANIDGADFTDADMARCDIIGAIVRNTSFRNANLTEASLSRTRFIDCDFREADLTWFGEPPRAGDATQTRFVRCDLRGAYVKGRRLNGTVFESCGFAGTSGAPLIEGPYSVSAPDFSVDFDGSDIRSSQEVFSLWGAG